MAVQGYDDQGQPFPAFKPGTVQVVAYSSSIATTNAVGRTQAVRVVCTTNAFVKIGAAPTATSSDTYLPAGVPEYFTVSASTDKLAFYAVSSAGNAYVTELL